MKNKIAIIGGGASGLVAAINLAKQNDVVLFEKDERVGKKILQTGNGRCNFCNSNLDPKFYNNPEFVGKVFRKVGKNEILDFFRGVGLCFCEDEEGRMYPQSNQANSVLDILRNECKRQNVKIQTSLAVDKIARRGEKFEIDSHIYDKVILATGNIPNNIPSDFGIKTIPQRQGLCGLKVENDEVAGLAGVRAKVCVKLKTDDICHEEKGEIQFKNGAVSGICIFNISSIISRKNMKKATIFVDFAPNFDKLSLKNEIQTRVKKLNNEPFENVFVGMFHKMIGSMFQKRCGVKNVACLDISSEQIDALVEMIKNCPFHILGTDGVGQVRVGGIDTNEVQQNLMSKKIPNLYFVGECLDVDGLCGGYNLAWAWASALVVAN